MNPARHPVTPIGRRPCKSRRAGAAATSDRRAARLILCQQNFFRVENKISPPPISLSDDHRSCKPPAIATDEGEGNGGERHQARLSEAGGIGRRGVRLGAARVWLGL